MFIFPLEKCEAVGVVDSAQARRQRPVEPAAPRDRRQSREDIRAVHASSAGGHVDQSEGQQTGGQRTSSADLRHRQHALATVPGPQHESSGRESGGSTGGVSVSAQRPSAALTHERRYFTRQRMLADSTCIDE